MFTLSEAYKRYVFGASVVGLGTAAGVHFLRSTGLDIAHDTALSFTFAAYSAWTVGASNETLARWLGRRKRFMPSLSVRSQPGAARVIPIGGSRPGSLVLQNVIKRPRFRDEPQARADDSDLPQLFTIHDVTSSQHSEPVSITFNEGELTNLLGAAWRRQLDDNGRVAIAPFSRNYFMTTYRPKLKRPEYEAFSILLLSTGVRSDRRQGRSGRMVLPPTVAMKQIKRFFYYSDAV